MRVCELHRETAIETLVSRKDGTEYDLCPRCRQLLEQILTGEREIEIPHISYKGYETIMVKPPSGRANDQVKDGAKRGRKRGT